MADKEPAPPRLTVAIPLFRAAAWYENLLENIQRIPIDAQILLSDEVSSDDTAQLVANHFKGDPRIKLRMRKGKPGWREHCNALIHECDTEFFSLLPQDDLIAPGYYQSLVAGLENNPDAGLAFGSLVAVGGSYLQPTQFFPPPIQLGLAEPWQEAIELEFRWNLGIPFRGVIRQTTLRPIPETPGDHFADQRWVFGMALLSHLLLVPDATYLKRYHDGNTHGRWHPPQLEERKAQLVAEIRSAFGNQDDADHVINHLYKIFQEFILWQWRKLGIC